MEKSRNGAVQSVQRAIQLLSLFAPQSAGAVQHRTAWTVTDLARATGLHKSVVARLMATMALDGFVIQDPTTRSYSIGPQAFAVGAAYEPYTVLNQVARPVMEELTARCGHASYVGVPAGSHHVFLIAVESQRSIRVSIKVGESRSYHSGAIGKVLLASLPDERVIEVLGTGLLPKMTEHTHGSVEGLLEELQTVRQTGIAFNNQESIPGAGSVAVGIRGANGECIAGLAIVYPTHIVTPEEREALTDIVRQAGADISERLGAVSPRRGLGVSSSTGRA